MTINTDILKNTAGLVMWLDGEINSRAGVRDTSINGMQNLVYTPFAGKSNTTGFREYFNGTPTFNDDKSITMGGSCFYPNYAVDDMTISWCVKFKPTSVGSEYVRHTISSTATGEYNNGYLNCVDFWEDGVLTVHFAAYHSGQQTKSPRVTLYPEHSEKKIYYAITTKLSEPNSSKLYINGVFVPHDRIDGIATPSTSVINSGVGCSSNTSTSQGSYGHMDFYRGTFNSEGDKWYFYRLWNRQLSEKEILDNYKRDFERFGA